MAMTLPKIVGFTSFVSNKNENLRFVLSENHTQIGSEMTFLEHFEVGPKSKKSLFSCHFIVVGRIFLKNAKNRKSARL